MTTKQNIKDYLLENIDTLRDVVSEINSYSGSLESFEYFYNDSDFLETFFSNDLENLTLRIFYGDYNPHDEYVMFNGYGNLVSLDDVGLDEMLREGVDEIADALIEYYDYIYVCDTNLDEMMKDIKENE